MVYLNTQSAFLHDKSHSLIHTQTCTALPSLYIVIGCVVLFFSIAHIHTSIDASGEMWGDVSCRHFNKWSRNQINPQSSDWQTIALPELQPPQKKEVGGIGGMERKGSGNKKKKKKATQRRAEMRTTEEIRG